MVNDLRGVSGGPFIAWRGRFPGDKRAGALVTDVGMAVETFLPKLRGPGARLGSDESGVRPTPPLQPLATVLCRVTGRWALFSICRCQGFVSRFALSCGPSL